MHKDVKKLLERIDKSPSCYHVIENLRCELCGAGYEELSEEAHWQIHCGGKYFAVRNGSALVAFQLPVGDSVGFAVAAAHSDSPTFKLKENPENRGTHEVRLNTEKYGGMLMATWFDRPLSVAGRIFTREGSNLVSHLVNIDRDLLVIPSVAIHMNRSANDGMKYQAHIDTVPLYGQGECTGLMALAAQAAGVKTELILGSDLFLYNRAKGTVFGADGEFIAAPRLDDLMCVYGCLEGFLQAQCGNSIPVLAIFDNEEVGSGTKQGAGSTFLRDTLRRIVLATGGGEEDFLRRMARSFTVSADNAHARHPNHPEYADADNCSYLNGGIVIKFNANQHYATDGRSAAVFRSICAEAGVTTQVMANRSDLPGGSTLGSISDTLLPVSTVDIGLPQLAMHSAYETAGAGDYPQLIRAMVAYFSHDF